MEDNITVNNESESYSSVILHVCRTGKKEQYYTLYQESLVVRKYMYNHNCHYVKNLAHTKEKAMAKAEVEKAQFIACNFWHTVEIQYHESPRMVYEKMTAFGTEFKTSRKGTTMWAYATPEFWENWKTSKQEIKDAGFWVKKFDDGWRVFVRRDAEFDHR